MSATRGTTGTARAAGRGAAVLAAATLTTCALVLGLAGCSNDGGAPSAAADGRTGAGGNGGLDTGGPGSDPQPKDAVTAPGLVTTGVLERSVIRTGSARIRTTDVTRAALSAAQAARGLGGMVSDEQTVTDPTDPGRTTSDLTLRVPNARFDDLITQIRPLGDILSLTQQATDVTGQVADIDARVDAQRASVRRIQALLSQATRIGDVIAIEGQLAQRQADLESMQAQQKALADQTALATFAISIVGPDPVGTADDPTGFMAGLRAGWKAFVGAMQTGLTALGAVLPFVGFFLVLALPILAWVRSRGRRTPLAPAPPSETLPEKQPVG